MTFRLVPKGEPEQIILVLLLVQQSFGLEDTGAIYKINDILLEAADKVYKLALIEPRRRTTTPPSIGGF